MDRGDVVAERFEIVGVCGAGGMGTVYSAHDRHTGQTVALKTIVGKDPHRIERFQREARLLAELRHPGIVGYVAHGTTPAGDLYLAMDLLGGEDLASRLGRGPLTVREALVVVRRAAEALDAAHAQKIVHRDVKPSNIFLCGDRMDDVRVLDFGIARLRESPSRMTNTGAVVGTPAYMAPEQARSSRDVDARADVYALGCVLFECITGQAPFSGDTPLAVLAKVLLAEAPRAGSLRADVPSAVDALVARLLSKDPDDRPTDAGALAAAIGAFDDTFPDAGPRSVGTAEALGRAERRLVSVVMIGREAAPTVSLDDASPSAPSRPRERTIQSIADAHGARLELLASGAALLTMSGAGVAVDQASRAARCALALREATPGTAIALATGRAVTGRVPIGEVIDRAALLLTKVGPEAALRVRIDEVTAGLLDARFDTGGDARGLLLLGERDTSEPRTLLGRPSPFVGREREIATLRAIFEQCVDEPVAQAVLVTGPAGMGKSRLESELLLALRRDGRDVEVWAARGDSLRAGSPLWLLAAAVRAAAGIRAGEPLGVMQQKLRARVARHVDPTDAARVAEFAGELCDVPFPDDDSVSLRAARRDAMLMGDQMRRAFEDWLGAECRARPLVLLLDDLHWGDLPTVQYVDWALRSLREAPLCVVAFARPEVHDLFPRIWEGRGIQEIRLGELTRRAGDRLAREVLGPRAGDVEIGRLVEQAAGNALCLEELVRAAALGRAGETPATVLAMLTTRLEALDPAARRVLRAASVFGQVFWQAGVHHLLGDEGPRGATDTWIRELTNQEVLARRSAGRYAEEQELGFRHPLVREAAYAMLVDEDRATGHRLAAAWLEDRGETDAAVLADHWERGGDRARAIGHYRQAALQALEASDFDAVVARARRGESLDAKGELLGGLRLLEAEARNWQGRFEEARGAAVDALRLLASGTRDWYAAAGELASACGRLSDHDGMLALAARMLALEPEGDLAMSAAVVAGVKLASRLFVRGHPAEGHALLWRMTAIRSLIPDPAPNVDPWIRVARVGAAWNDGALEDGYITGPLEAALAFERIGDLRTAAMQRVEVAWGYLQAGAFAETLEIARSSLEAADRFGLDRLRPIGTLAVGFALFGLGHEEEARPHLEAAALHAAKQNDRFHHGFTHVVLALVDLAEDDLEQAERHTRQAMESLGAAPAMDEWLLSTRAKVELRLGRVDAALTNARAAMAILEGQQGATWAPEASVRVALADALEAAGDHEAAREVIEKARDVLLERASTIRNTTLREGFLGRMDNARIRELAARWCD